VLGLVGAGFADLTAEGGTAGAPVFDCPVTTTTSSTPSTSDTTTTTDATTTTAVAAGGGRELARTGPQVGPTLWVGALMLVGGVLMVALARRRYAETRK
jgi:hypothetical protein